MNRKKPRPQNRGEENSRYHPNSSDHGHLSCSVTGAPVPVIPGDADSGLQTILSRAFTTSLSLAERNNLLNFLHSLCISLVF